MAELYRFFNSTPDDKRTYQATDFAQFFTNFLGNGFFNGLSVTASDSMVVGVRSGSAMIEGHQYTNTDTKDLTVDGADSTNDRIDRVVLRLDANTDKRYIKAFIKKGQTASNPVPPELERTDYIYELSLAQVRIEAGKSFIDSSQLTDERGDNDLMGRVQVARTIGDQINTVDIKGPNDTPDKYAEGISQFYLSGSSNPEHMTAWLISLGMTPTDFGRDLSSLRAYVHTVGNRTNTGLQTFTLFDWAYQQDYRIYGEWKRANNAISENVRWGAWHDTELIVDEIENENGKCIKYSSGKMECRFVTNIGDRMANGTGTYTNPYRTSSLTWNFPESFIAPPVVSGTSETESNSAPARAISVGFRSTSNSSAPYIQGYALSSSDIEADVILNLVATGRWRR